MDQKKRVSTLGERMSDSDITIESPPKSQGGSKSQKDGESPRQ
jgi:hypothetical protein